MIDGIRYLQYMRGEEAARAGGIGDFSNHWRQAHLSRTPPEDRWIPSYVRNPRCRVSASKAAPEEKISVLTKEILFGMNLLTVAGFLVMGLSLTLHRTGNAGVPVEHRPHERWNGSGALRLLTTNS